jgi:phosphopantothenate-cysteine ligase
MPSESSESSFSAESYFETQLPPPSLQEDISKVRDFVRKQKDVGRKVVLVTVRLFVSSSVLWIDLRSIKSGGTTVPLELNV